MTKPPRSPSSFSSFPLLQQTGLLVALLVFISLMIVRYTEDINSILAQPGTYQPSTKTHIASLTKKKNQKLAFSIGEADKGCDLFSGRWVRGKTQPLYDESCPFLKPQVTCREHGRPDTEYLYWRWQPYGCSIPSFNATLLLESLRGKKVMFVGDSLNRGQYMSFICMLQGVIPEHAKSEEASGPLRTFTAKEYNTTVQYFAAPLILESNDVLWQKRAGSRIVSLGSVDKQGSNWIGADVIVFGSYLWWMTGKGIDILKGSFDDKVQDIMKLPDEEAYRTAIQTTLKWIEQNMDPSKTRVFFTSQSPTHSTTDWPGGDPELKCYNETTPIEDLNYFSPHNHENILQASGELLGKSKFPVTFLNITQLSSYRKDAHSTIYKQQWGPPTPEKLAKPWSYADCVHWCLPGIPDTWNQLLFAKLFYP